MIEKTRNLGSVRATTADRGILRSNKFLRLRINDRFTRIGQGATGRRNFRR